MTTQTSKSDETTAEYVARVGTVAAVLQWESKADRCEKELDTIDEAVKVLLKLISLHVADEVNGSAKITEEEVLDVANWAFAGYKSAWKKSLRSAQEQIDEILLEPWSDVPASSAMFPSVNISREAASIKSRWKKAQQEYKAGLAGVEPTTYRLGGDRSIH